MDILEEMLKQYEKKVDQKMKQWWQGVLMVLLLASISMIIIDFPDQVLRGLAIAITWVLGVAIIIDKHSDLKRKTQISDDDLAKIAALEFINRNAFKTTQKTLQEKGYLDLADIEDLARAESRAVPLSKPGAQSLLDK